MNQVPFTEERPWGEFRQLTAGEPSTVKLIRVKPNQALSLQYHRQRTEFWVVLSGAPEVTIGGKVVRAKVGDEFFVPREAEHRLTAGPEPVEILEIAQGEVDENDIVRLEDNYGRV